MKIKVAGTKDAQEDLIAHHYNLKMTLISGIT